MLAGLFGSSDVRPWPVLTATGLASHILASVNSTPLPRVFGHVKAISAPDRYWWVSEMVHPPTRAFMSRPLSVRKRLPLPTGMSKVLMKLNTFGRSNAMYDFGWVRLYM